MTQIAPRTHATERTTERTTGRTPLPTTLRSPAVSPVGTPLLREVYGRLLRRLRTRQARTLAEVAGRAGVSVAYLSEIERGLKEPSSEVLEAVCVALGSSITDLVGAAHRELRELASDAASSHRVLDLTSPVGSSISAPLPGAAPGRVLLAA